MITKRENTPDIAKVLSAENIKAFREELALIDECLNKVADDSIENYPALLTVDNIGELATFCSEFFDECHNWFRAFEEIQSQDDSIEELIEEYYEKNL